MSVLETITAIGTGRPTERLLGNCRLAVGGYDGFGIEAIGDAFRCDPLVVEQSATTEDERHFALVADGHGLFVDLYDGNVGRLWRVGRPTPHAPEPFIAVAFDPDLRQKRGDLAFDASDHPGLDDGAHDRVREAGLALLDHDATAWRSRGFCIRAFGSKASGAALFAIYRMSGGVARTNAFGFAIARWHGEQLDLAIDVIGVVESPRAGSAS